MTQLHRYLPLCGNCWGKGDNRKRAEVKFDTEKGPERAPPPWKSSLANVLHLFLESSGRFAPGGSQNQFSRGWSGDSHESM